MPRYVVERFFDKIGDDEMLALGRKSDQVKLERFPEVTWEHSHLCVDADGAITTFCVYEAPSEQMICDHAEAFGGHTILRIMEIADDVTPADVRAATAAA